MTKYLSYLLFILFLYLSHHSAGEETDIEQLKASANKVRDEGAQQFNEGLTYQALENFQLFLELRKKIYTEDKYYLGAAYLNIAIAYKDLGQLDLALENFKMAEVHYLLKDDPNRISLAGLYLNIGNVFRAKLDYTNALNYFERALSIYQKQEEPDLIDISDAFYSISEINYLLGNYETSIAITTMNMDICDEFNQILYNELLATSYNSIGKIDEAQKFFILTLELAKNYYEKDELDLAVSYTNYAEFLISINEFNESLLNLETAFEIIKISQPTRGEHLSRYYELMGALFQEKPIQSPGLFNFRTEKKKNLNTSVKWYTKGLNALSSTNHDININSLRIENCLSFLDCLAILQQIGDAHYELALVDKAEKNQFYKNSLIKALEYYQSAKQLTQQARQEISSDDSKVQLAELEHSTFTKTIETAYLAYEATGNNKFIELAFNSSEQVRSSSVFDKLSNDLAKENSLIPDSLIQYEKRLNSTISIFTQKIFEESSYDDADSLLIEEFKAKVFEASKERDELNRLLEEEYSDYYNLKYAKNVLSIRGIQNEMGRNEAIFEYLIVEPDEYTETQNNVDTTSLLFTFLITKDQFIFHKNSIDNNSRKSLETVFSFMSNPAYLFTQENDSKNFCSASHNLYNLLIAPFQKEITNKNLLIIPDGHLNYISFDGLLQTLPDTSRSINFSTLNYLIKDYNINYANSVNILFQHKGVKQKLKNRTLAFAPEYDSEKFNMSNASYTLMPLPGVQKEVDDISEAINTTIFRGEDASEKNFRKESNDYDILHLAMHAYINDSLPAFSRLAFSPEPEGKAIDDDGWLNTIDIYNLELNAHLAVLSACNTGVGKLQKGEGMMSLARGFLFAGCPSIIMSLWEVDDNSGTQIMSSFYRNLKKGKTKDEALRSAKLNYLEKSNSRLAHPHYWMSFKSIGDNSPLYTSYDIYFFALLIILILAFTIDQGLRIRKIKKKKQNS